MAKKTMKRSLALGALMAFAITGSAMAAELSNDTNVADGYNGGYKKHTLATEKVELTRDSFNNVLEKIDIELAKDEQLTVTSNYVGPRWDFGVINDAVITGNGDVVIQQLGNDSALSSGIGVSSFGCTSITFIGASFILLSIYPM